MEGGGGVGTNGEREGWKILQNSINGGMGVGINRGWKILENLIAGVAWRKFYLARQNRIQRS